MPTNLCEDESDYSYLLIFQHPLFICPAVACLEIFQPNQHVGWNVVPRRNVRIQYLERFFIQAAEELPIERACPRIPKALAQILGQFVHMAGARHLLCNQFVLITCVFGGCGLKFQYIDSRKGITWFFIIPRALMT